MWNSSRSRHGLPSARLPWWCVLLATLAVTSWAAAQSPSPVAAEATPSWQNRFETLQAGVRQIVPRLEAELRTAKSELGTSRAERRTVDEALAKSQTDLSASETEQQALAEKSRQLEQRIADLETRISELNQRLTEALNSWTSSESSRATLAVNAEWLTARLQEEQAARESAERQGVVIGVASGVGGAALGILIYEGIKALINLFQGAK